MFVNKVCTKNLYTVRWRGAGAGIRGPGSGIWLENHKNTPPLQTNTVKSATIQIMHSKSILK